MDLFECLRADRATRDFADRSVADKTVERLVDNARYAGSGHNRQPWTFIAVRDPDRRSALARFGEYTTPLRRAPVGIILAADRGEHDIHQWINVFDCGRAAQNLMLTATATGLGTVPQAFTDEDRAREFLDLPKGKRVFIGFAVGYPATEPDDTIEGVSKEEELEDTGRCPVSEILHWETYR